MRAATTKMLRYYSRGQAGHFDQLKLWWKGLTHLERAQAAAEIRAVIEKRKAAALAAAKSRQVGQEE